MTLWGVAAVRREPRRRERSNWQSVTRIEACENDLDEHDREMEALVAGQRVQTRLLGGIFLLLAGGLVTLITGLLLALAGKV